MARSLLQILENTDTYLPSEAEITTLSKFEDQSAAINDYFEHFNVKEVVLKCGSKGATVFTQSKSTYNRLSQWTKLTLQAPEIVLAARILRVE